MSFPRLSELTGCLADYDPHALPVEKAQQIIREFVAPVAEVEHAALLGALGRVLADDIISPIDVPQHDNSAMDGYAFSSACLSGAERVSLDVVATVLAGERCNDEIRAGQCVRIMTGAPMPPGCDTVIPQELTVAAPDAVSFDARAVKAGDNRRLRGEDLKAGVPALAKGRVLRPADLGLLASLGIAEVPVRRRLRVAFFSTGDELRSIGQPLEPGCVYDSNRYSLHGMLSRLGCELVDMGVVKDDPVSLKAAFLAACECADAVVTTGGVSVGEADYTKQIMAELGDVTFWKIGMRPGRPMAFGRVSSNGKSACLFGLPGNPVAVMVTFYFFARNALLRMMGAEDAPLPLLRVASQSDIRKKPGRTEYQRGILSRDENGVPQVRITGAQGSGILRSMVEANCIVVLGDGQGTVKAGDMVDVVVFEGLI